MQDIFISYAHQDKPVAEAVCRALEDHAVKCWIAPRDILPGMSWSEAIIDGIEESQIVLLIFSEAANQSPQVCREIERAVHKGVAVLPLRIENVAPDKEFEYFLGAVHWLDAFEPNTEAHLPQVIETVNAMLNRIVSRTHATTYALPPTPEASANNHHRTPERRLDDRRNEERRTLERQEQGTHTTATQTAARMATVTDATPDDDHKIAEQADQGLAKAGLDRMELKAGEALFRQGEEGDSMFMLESGQMTVMLQLPNGENRTLFTIEPMAIVGEMSLLLNSVRTATVIADTDASLWRVTHAKFQESLRNRERWAIKLMMGVAQTLARHVEAMNQEVVAQMEHIHKLQNELQPASAAELEDFCDRLVDKWTF
jgi:CRP-like cAMP-binding protein